jgi:hypothetical protein
LPSNWPYENKAMALTVTDLLAEASRLLTENGYTAAEPGVGSAWLSSSGRVFEDAYGVVGLAVFETWSELRHSWPDAQSSLGELISRHLTRADAKSWEVYLVLLTPGVLGNDDQLESQLIRSDTNRARKLVATGAELQSISNVERVLLPLLPLTGDITVTDEGSLLDRLPDLLEVDQGAARVIVDAFRNQEPILERLHKYLEH